MQIARIEAMSFEVRMQETRIAFAAALSSEPADSFQAEFRANSVQHCATQAYNRILPEGDTAALGTGRTCGIPANRVLKSLAVTFW